MRKVSLKFVSVILGIVFILVLFACPKPVDFGDFLKPSGNPGGGDPSDPGEQTDPLAPKLVWSVTGGELIEGDEVTVSLNPTPQSGTITVTNAEVYDSIKWFCVDLDTPLSDDETGDDYGEELAVTAGKGPFVQESKVYPVTVVGHINTTEHSTKVIIAVVEDNS